MFKSPCISLLMQESQLVWLNVSGTRFCATRNTLLQYDDTFFHRLLGSSAIGSMRDETGALFIGRPARLFSVILDFLTTGALDIPAGVSRERVDREMEYYGLVAYAETPKEEDLDARLELARLASMLLSKKQKMSIRVSWMRIAQNL